jgi:hypothetical protein
LVTSRTTGAFPTNKQPTPALPVHLKMIKSMRPMAGMTKRQRRHDSKLINFVFFISYLIAIEAFKLGMCSDLRYINDVCSMQLHVQHGLLD